MKKNLFFAVLTVMVVYQCMAFFKKGEKMEIKAESLLLFAGSYAPASDQGIKVFSFNQESADFAFLTGAAGVSNPSYLCINSTQNRVYAVGEDEGSTATVNVLSFDRERLHLALEDTGLTLGGAPCNLVLSPAEDYVLTANYFGGNISVFPLTSDGILKDSIPHILSFSGKSIHPERQTKPYLHSVRFTPDKRFMVANDLGSDRLYLYPVYMDDTLKQTTTQALLPLLDETHRRDVVIKPGSGPRHLCFHPGGKYCYLLNELSGMVVSMRYEQDTLIPFQYIASDTVGAEGSADIHCSADGKFVYASNRLKADGIAIFQVNPSDGSLMKVGYQLTGKHPRNFIITPNDKFLLVACRDENTIEIYLRDSETGLLSDTGKRISMIQPVCLKFAGY